MRRARGALLAAVVLTAAGGEAQARAKHATAHATTGKPSAAASSASACVDSDETALWWSPLAPAAGATIKLLAVGEESGAGELAAIGPDGEAPRAHRGAPPGRPPRACRPS